MLTSCVFSRPIAAPLAPSALPPAGCFTPLSRFVPSLDILRTLLHFFAFFCTPSKLIPLLFNHFQTLCAKHPGVGGISAGVLARRPNPFPLFPQPVGTGPHTIRRNSNPLMCLQSNRCIPPGYGSKCPRTLFALYRLANGAFTLIQATAAAVRPPIARKSRPRLLCPSTFRPLQPSNLPAAAALLTTHCSLSSATLVPRSTPLSPRGATLARDGRP
jgi:hypothetical protein